MEKLVFDRRYFEHLYNCSHYTPAEWKSFGKVNIPIGVSYITIGIIYEILYIPIMFVMAKKEFIQHSCYKIMFLLGIIDIIAVFCNSLMSGYFSLVGAVYCTHPTLVYMVGVFSPSSWCGACATVLLLAFNRFMDLVSPYYSDLLFSGKRTFFWLILPGLYWFYFWFIDLPCIYSSIASACFFDPFFGVSFPRNEWEYANWGLTFNNVAIILALSGMYIAIISALIAKTRMSTAATAIQRNTILQAFLICTLCFIASAIYVCMQYLPTPSFVIILGQIFWQASHGGAVFIYLIFNKALRRGLLKLVLPETLQKRLENVTFFSNVTTMSRNNNNSNNRSASAQVSVSQISHQLPLA